MKMSVCVPSKAQLQTSWMLKWMNLNISTWKHDKVAFMARS